MGIKTQHFKCVLITLKFKYGLKFKELNFALNYDSHNYITLQLSKEQTIINNKSHYIIRINMHLNNLNNVCLSVYLIIIRVFTLVVLLQ